jgi:hypothetical protein
LPIFSRFLVKILLSFVNFLLNFVVVLCHVCADCVLCLYIKPLTKMRFLCYNACDWYRLVNKGKIMDIGREIGIFEPGEIPAPVPVEWPIPTEEPIPVDWPVPAETPEEEPIPVDWPVPAEQPATSTV